MVSLCNNKTNKKIEKDDPLEKIFAYHIPGEELLSRTVDNKEHLQFNDEKKANFKMH